LLRVAQRRALLCARLELTACSEAIHRAACDREATLAVAAHRRGTSVARNSAVTAETLRLNSNPFPSLVTLGARLRDACAGESRSGTSAADGSWVALRPALRLYVGVVVAAGALAIVAAIPQLGESQAGLFTSLAILSLVTAFAKVTVQLTGGGVTVSICYVVDFTALLLLGVPYATLTTAAGAWAQGTLKSRAPSRPHQTWFSIGVLAITVQSAALVYAALGGRVGEPQPLSHLGATAGAAAAYFLVNSIMIAAAVAMSDGRSIARVWWATFAPMSRGYLLGFPVAALAAAGIAQSSLWLVPVAAAIVGLTQRNLKTYADGVVDSNTDALTGLCNRRSLLSRAAQELARAQRAHSALAVLVVDFDNFKTINDTYGHSAGDALLREAVTRLRGTLRTYDICARYGGDEFVVVLPGCGIDDANHKAEVIREALEQAAYEVKPHVSLSVRVSIGTAAFPEHGRTWDSLFTAADREMYADKAARRTAGPRAQNTRQS
jgi:diguanylate cyclase (GGDEF)-like protein